MTGPWSHALITDASSDVGEAFARELAPQCGTLTLVARREDSLRHLADQLGADCHLRTLEINLLDTVGRARVVEYIRQRGPIDLLINSAGVSTIGDFSASVLDDELAVLRLQQDLPLQLIRAVLPAQLAAGRGAIINVASLSGFLPAPTAATCGAANAFLLGFSRSLATEVAGSGVQVQCLCPGLSGTGHLASLPAGAAGTKAPEGELRMFPGAPVRESLRALDEGRWLVMPDTASRALALEALAELSAALREQPAENSQVGG